jgi:hypothetical protein
LSVIEEDPRNLNRARSNQRVSWNLERVHGAGEGQDMNEVEKVEKLFKTTAEELVKSQPSEWNEAFSGIHSEDLQLLANKVIQLAVNAARMGAYIEARAKGKSHKEAVGEQNVCAEKVRAALDFQHPKEDIDF